MIFLALRRGHRLPSLAPLLGPPLAPGERLLVHTKNNLKSQIGIIWPNYI